MTPLRRALVGLALDAVALAGLFVTQEALGLGDNLGGAWPVAVGFVTIPWLVHALLLPPLAGAPWPKASRAAAMTAAYVVGAALLIPAVGALVMALAAVSGLFDSHVWDQLGGLLSGIEPGLRKRVGDVLGNLALIVCLPGPVGAVIGAMGGLLRRGLTETAAPQPPWKADIFGGFAAAVLGFGGLALAEMSGALLEPTGKPPWDATPEVYPALGTAVGLIALLPHLLLTARVSPPRATSAFCAAPTAPSR